MRHAEGAIHQPGLPAALRASGARLLTAVDDVVDYRALVPLRIAVGVLTIVQLAPFLADAADGRTYADGFTVPYGAWYPELPGTVYVAALALAAVAGVFMACGLFTRVTTTYTAAFFIYNLFLSRTHYHHNRAFLGVLLVGLALVPAGNAISLDALRNRRRGRPRPAEGRRWPLMLLRFQVGAVYAASGFSKLLDPDWFGGTVLRLRVERQAATSVAAGVPQWLVDVIASPQFQAVFAKVVVLTEIFIGLGLLVPRLRTAAIWVAIPFHVAIAVTADVEVFSWAALAALTIWVTPRAHDREVVIGSRIRAMRGWATIVRLLDWTGRFRVTVDPAQDVAVVLRDRDGSVRSGQPAAVRVATLLPATFFIAAPLGVTGRWGVHSPQGTTSRRTG